MNTEITKIYEAHVAYEMLQWQGEKLKNNIAKDVNTIDNWLKEQKLSDIAPKQHVKDTIHRWVNHIEISDAAKDLGVKIFEDILDFIEKEDIDLDDLIQRDTYDKIVEEIIARKDTREEIIHKLMSNPFYGEMISDMLYNGIKSFMQEFGSSLGGKSSNSGGGLFSIGKGILGAALSGLEENVDKNVRKFLTENINKTIRDNEKMLNEKLSDKNIRKMADKLYDTLDDLDLKKVVAKVKKAMEGNKTKEASDIIVELLAQWRSSKTVKAVFEQGIDSFYSVYGKKKLAVLDKDMNIDMNIFAEEIYISLLPAFNKMYEDGLTEKMIRQRLEGFYNTL